MQGVGVGPELRDRRKSSDAAVFPQMFFFLFLCAQGTGRPCRGFKRRFVGGGGGGLTDDNVITGPNGEQLVQGPNGNLVQVIEALYY